MQSESEWPAGSGAEEAALQRLREDNIKALLSNNLQTCRQPLVSKFLVIKEGEQLLRRTFRSPHPGAPAVSETLRKKLVARKRFIPWGCNEPFKRPVAFSPILAQDLPAEAVEEDLPPGIEPLVLWEPAADQPGDTPVVVDNMLTKFLRPHQREGVQFMFECVTGLRLTNGQAAGCILADDMGLGKTLQGITLLWTLLKQGADTLGSNPLAKRVIIVCPTSLVSNWDNEMTKWLKGRVRTLALCESSRDDVVAGVKQYLHTSNPYHCLIISYETFRLHADKFAGEGACDLLICDEAHRLKNDATLTNRALDSLQCRRRVLLSGTPMQNHLDEFFAMVDFCNPSVLGTPGEFRRYFANAILAGREPGAADADVALGEERSGELSSLVNQFILRRTNKVLSDHLPPKVVEVVVCRLTPLQQQLYIHFLESNTARRLLAGNKAAGVLSAITSLKKLCNHPKLIYDAIHSKTQGDGAAPDGFEGVGALFPPGIFDNGRPGRGGLAVGWECLSGKMALVARMLETLKSTTDDRIVIVSNYTQTLDLFAQLCRQCNYGHLRLDGSTSISKRQKLVAQFNDPTSNNFVFLLSSKAGGCGLNLIGGNRLVLFDPDWNPANDKQAAARVWRDGQKKRVYVYRLLTAGSIEEKVFQRQISKEGLQQVVDAAATATHGPGAAGGGGASGSSCGGGGGSSNLLSAEELRELFTLRPDTASDTYDLVCSSSSRGDAAALSCMVDGYRPQIGTPSEEDLQHFGHHHHSALHTVPDDVLRQVAGGDVTFVFSNQVAGKKEVAQEQQPASTNSSSSTSSRQRAATAGSTHSLKPSGMPVSSTKMATIAPATKAAAVVITTADGTVSSSSAVLHKRSSVSAEQHAAISTSSAAVQPAAATPNASPAPTAQQQQQQQAEPPESRCQPLADSTNQPSLPRLYTDPKSAHGKARTVQRIQLSKPGHHRLSVTSFGKVGVAGKEVVASKGSRTIDDDDFM